MLLGYAHSPRLQVVCTTYNGKVVERNVPEIRDAYFF